jgi:hypothetical protein
VSASGGTGNTTTVGLSTTASPTTVAPSTTAPSTTVAPSTSPAPTTIPPSEVGVVRLGCGLFCQNAGGYGGEPDDDDIHALRIDKSGFGEPVHIFPDGTVPISVSCLVATTCRGALLLDVGGFHLRSDLVIPPNQTVVFGMSLSPDVVAAIRTLRSLNAGVTADGSLTATCAYVIHPGQTCTRFLPPPVPDPTTGQVTYSKGSPEPPDDEVEDLEFGSLNLVAA